MDNQEGKILNFLLKNKNHKKYVILNVFFWKQNKGKILKRKKKCIKKC